MARSKSTSGGKTNLTNTSTSTSTNKDQARLGNPANIPDVNAVAAETSPAGITPEVKVTPEPRKLEVVRTEPRKNVAGSDQS
jgi:hypothetical protein